MIYLNSQQGDESKARTLSVSDNAETIEDFLGHGDSPCSSEE